MENLFDEYQEEIDEIKLYSGIEEGIFNEIEIRVKRIIENSNGQVLPIQITSLIQNIVSSLYQNDHLPLEYPQEALDTHHIVTLDLAIINAFENIGYSIGKKGR